MVVVLLCHHTAKEKKKKRKRYLALWPPLIRVLTSFIGEGNGNPLQYSCLENPMDGGAW